MTPIAREARTSVVVELGRLFRPPSTVCERCRRFVARDVPDHLRRTCGGFVGLVDDDEEDDSRDDWQPHEIALLRADYGRRKAKDIGRDLGRTVRAVYAKASLLGLPGRVRA